MCDHCLCLSPNVCKHHLVLQGSTVKQLSNQGKLWEFYVQASITRTWSEKYTLITKFTSGLKHGPEVLWSVWGLGDFTSVGLEYFQQMGLITQLVFHQALHQAVWFMPRVVSSHLTQLLSVVNLWIHLLWTHESTKGFNRRYVLLNMALRHFFKKNYLFGSCFFL